MTKSFLAGLIGFLFKLISLTGMTNFYFYNKRIKIYIDFEPLNNSFDLVYINFKRSIYLSTLIMRI